MQHTPLKLPWVCCYQTKVLVSQWAQSEHPAETCQTSHIMINKQWQPTFQNQSATTIIITSNNNKDKHKVSIFVSPIFMNYSQLSKKVLEERTRERKTHLKVRIMQIGRQQLKTCASESETVTNLLNDQNTEVKLVDYEVNVLRTHVQLPAVESHSFQHLIGAAVTTTSKNSAASGDGFHAAQAPLVGLTCKHMI